MRTWLSVASVAVLLTLTMAVADGPSAPAELAPLGGSQGAVVYHSPAGWTAWFNLVVESTPESYAVVYATVPLNPGDFNRKNPDQSWFQNFHANNAQLWVYREFWVDMGSWGYWSWGYYAGEVGDGKFGLSADVYVDGSPPDWWSSWFTGKRINFDCQGVVREWNWATYAYDGPAYDLFSHFVLRDGVFQQNKFELNALPPE